MPITEKSTVSISLMIIIIGSVVGLTTMYNQGNATAKVVESYSRSLVTIDERLSRIEGQLGLAPLHGH